MRDYKNTPLYRQGLFHKELGELLTNPDTELDAIVDFANKWGVDVQVALSPIGQSEGK